MATLQIRDFPDELHEKLKELAKKEHRSITQQALVLLKQVLEKPDYAQKRKEFFERIASEPSGKYEHLPDPVKMVREDRDR